MCVRQGKGKKKNQTLKREEKSGEKKHASRPLSTLQTELGALRL